MASNGTPVKLYIYDLSKGLARSMSLPLLGKQIEGVWHTGIVVYGEEYFFGGTGGIESCPPCGTMLGQPDQIVDLGSTQIPKEMFLDYLSELAVSSFRSEKYQLFSHNCNNFSDEVSQFLTGNKIPSYITNLPAEVLNTPLGAMFKPMVEAMSVEPTGGHSLFPDNNSSQPAVPSATQSQCSSQTPNSAPPVKSSSTKQSSCIGISQTPVIFTYNLFDHMTVMKGEECQGTVQSATSSLGLNLWNETLEYLQTANPSWSLSKDHIHIIGQILCDNSIKDVVWTSTCYMLQNLMLIEDFIPVLSHSSEKVLQKILHFYQNYSSQRQGCVIKVIANLFNSVAGRNMLFGKTGDLILKKTCIQICCNGLLSGNQCVLKPSSALAFNFTFAETDDEVEVELSSAVTSTLEQTLDETTAKHLLSCLIKMMKKNPEVKSLVAVMGYEWPNLSVLSEEINILHATLKDLCSNI